MRVSPDHPFYQARLFRIGVNRGDGLEAFVVIVEEIDGRPVAELRDDDREHPVERGLQVERFGQHFAGLRQKCKELALALIVVDVGAEAEPARSVAVLAVERRDEEPKPPVHAVGAPQAQLELERGGGLHFPDQGLVDKLAIVAMHRRPPRLLQRGGRGVRARPQTGVLAPLAVELQHPAVPRRGPRDFRNFVEGQGLKRHNLRGFSPRGPIVTHLRSRRRGFGNFSRSWVPWTRFVSPCRGKSSVTLDNALKHHFGYAAFRPLQREIIEATLAGPDVIALLPTGGGKSLCFQLPALVEPGLTVVVSPLIALMKDQVDALEASGVAATFLNSSLDPPEAARRIARLDRGQYRLLYVAPERLSCRSF